jgi:hypothetical protein
VISILGGPVNKTNLRSLNFSVTRVRMKIFRTFSVVIIIEYQIFFSIPQIDTEVEKINYLFLVIIVL